MIDEVYIVYWWSTDDMVDNPLGIIKTIWGVYASEEGAKNGMNELKQIKQFSENHQTYCEIESLRP